MEWASWFSEIGREDAELPLLGRRTLFPDVREFTDDNPPSSSVVDAWMASPTQSTWVWVNCGSWWRTGRPGVLQFMGLQRVGHDWVTELNWTETLTLRKGKNGRKTSCGQWCLVTWASGRAGRQFLWLYSGSVIWINVVIFYSPWLMDPPLAWVGAYLISLSSWLHLKCFGEYFLLEAIEVLYPTSYM